MPTCSSSVAREWQCHPQRRCRDPFAITADAVGLHAERTFTVRPAPDGSSTVVVSDETQVGLLPRLGRVFLAPRLHAANQAMFDDLARAADHVAVTPE